MPGFQCLPPPRRLIAAPAAHDTMRVCSTAILAIGPAQPAASIRLPRRDAVNNGAPNGVRGSRRARSEAKAPARYFYRLYIYFFFLRLASVRFCVRDGRGARASFRPAFCYNSFFSRRNGCTVLRRLPFRFLMTRVWSLHWIGQHTVGIVKRSTNLVYN